MKHLILITFLSSAISFAADKGPKAVKPNEVKSGIVINESLQKLMDIDGVMPIYETCKKSGIATDTTKLLNCLWTGVQKNEDLKKKVITAYNDELKAKPDTTPGVARAPASKEEPKTNMTGRNISSATDYGTDSAVTALTKYYGEKLDAILDPEKALTAEENKKGLILATNHRQFIDLYKSELGKTIVNAFTSYCLDTDPDTCTASDYTCTLKSTQEEIAKDRIRNIDSLKNADLSSDSPESKKWKSCISAVPKICKDAKGKDPKDSIRELSESEKRSCLIMDYVEAARKSIIAADAQTKFYDDLAKTQTVQIANLSKDVDTSSDAILKMSSEDVNKALKDPLEKDSKELEACYKDGAIVNAKACEKFLSVNVKDNNMAIAEMGIRQIAQEAALEKELDSSTTKVADYLKEEGFSKEEITEMTSDEAKIKKVKEEILERYKNKKAAIIAEMAEKIQSKTATDDGKVGTADVSKLEKIRAELASRKNDLAGLVKFNNVVSSYLEVKKEGSKTNDRNTASLFGEIDDMKNDADRKLASEQAKKANLERVKSEKGQSQTNLDVKTINDEFLNYTVQKKKDK